jgi:hypothetical protein
VRILKEYEMDNMNLSIVEAKKELRLQEWQERIRECRTSGLSVSEWCKRNDIGVKRYYYWHSVDTARKGKMDR